MTQPHVPTGVTLTRADQLRHVIHYLSECEELKVQTSRYGSFAFCMGLYYLELDDLENARASFDRCTKKDTWLEANKRLRRVYGFHAVPQTRHRHKYQYDAELFMFITLLRITLRMCAPRFQAGNHTGSWRLGLMRLERNFLATSPCHSKFLATGECYRIIFSTAKLKLLMDQVATDQHGHDCQKVDKTTQISNNIAFHRRRVDDAFEVVRLKRARTEQINQHKEMEAEQRAMERYHLKTTAYLQQKEEALKSIREMGLLPEEALREYQNPSYHQLSNRLHNVKEALKKYSHVNKQAFEQYQNFTKQRGELDARKEELDNAAEAIEDLIKNLDQRKDEVISGTFKQVAQFFEEVWERLVPAGRGRLLMLRRTVGGNDESQDAAAEMLRTRTKDASMQIFVKTLTGKTILVEVRPEDKVSALLWKVLQKCAVDDDGMYLRKGGKILAGNCTLAYYDILPESTIYLCGRLRGGGKSDEMLDVYNSLPWVAKEEAEFVKDEWAYGIVFHSSDEKLAEILQALEEERCQVVRTICTSKLPPIRSCVEDIEAAQNAHLISHSGQKETAPARRGSISKTIGNFAKTVTGGLAGVFGRSAMEKEEENMTQLGRILHVVVSVDAPERDVKLLQLLQDNPVVHTVVILADAEAANMLMPFLVGNGFRVGAFDAEGVFRKDEGEGKGGKGKSAEKEETKKRTVTLGTVTVLPPKKLKLVQHIIFFTPAKDVREYQLGVKLLVEAGGRVSTLFARNESSESAFTVLYNITPLSLRPTLLAREKEAKKLSAERDAVAAAAKNEADIKTAEMQVKVAETNAAREKSVAENEAFYWNSCENIFRRNKNSKYPDDDLPAATVLDYILRHQKLVDEADQRVRKLTAENKRLLTELNETKDRLESALESLAKERDASDVHRCLQEVQAGSDRWEGQTIQLDAKARKLEEEKKQLLKQVQNLQVAYNQEQQAHAATTASAQQSSDNFAQQLQSTEEFAFKNGVQMGLAQASAAMGRQLR
ncbi:Structural maintenance of chromosomes protein 3 [Rhizophlyctis rosea]|nr:Structural maintenance of chromosomes protein 3 [Rhizophlyctis rosea]